MSPTLEDLLHTSLRVTEVITVAAVVCLAVDKIRILFNDHSIRDPTFNYHRELADIFFINAHGSWTLIKVCNSEYVDASFINHGTYHSLTAKNNR